MITKQQIIDDVFLQLYQAQPSQDEELPYEQVAQWLEYHLNQLVANECNEKLKRGESIPPIYIQIADCKIPIVEDIDCADDCHDRIYITVPETLTLNKGGEILDVRTSDGDRISKTSVESMLMFRNLKFGKPSDKNLLYYKIGNKIYVEGIKNADIEAGDEINVFYVPKQDIMNLADDGEVLVSDLTLPMLINSIVERGKLQLYGTEADPDNDGQDVKETQYHRAIANPTNNQPQPQ